MLMVNKIISSIKHAVKEDLVYIIGNYGIRLASFVFTILVAKNISPENYGLFGLATLIITYLAYFNLGSQYSINKELSIDITNTKLNAYALINSVAFTVFIISFALFIHGFNLLNDLHPYSYYLILYPILYNILEISNGILRAHNKSTQLGIIKLAGTLGVVGITFYYFIAGVPNDPTPLFLRFLLFQAIEIIISLYFLSKVYKFKFSDIRVSINIKYIKYLIMQGLVLSLYVTIDGFTKSIDRLFIASFYSKAELGYYSFGVALHGPFLLAIGSIMYMDFSRVLKRFSESNKSDFYLIVNKVYKKLIIIWLITLIASIIFSYLFLKFYVPNYLPSYFVIVIYIFNVITRILIFPYTSFLIANNYQIELIKVIIVPSIINIVLSYTVVLLKFPYIFILLVTFPSNFVYLFFLQNLFKKRILRSNAIEKNFNSKTISTNLDI